MGGGGAGGEAFFMLFIARTSMKIINARIIKLIKMVMKLPYAIVGILAFFKSASAVNNMKKAAPPAPPPPTPEDTSLLREIRDALKR